MKAKRNLMIGLVILLVILAAGVFAAKTVSDKDAAASASADAAISLTSITASSEIESFGYTFEGDTLTFEQRQEVVEDESASDNTSEAASDSTRTAGSEETEPETETVWYLVDDPEYKLDQSTVNSMLTAFVNLEASRQLTETSEEYGLEEPTLTFWMTANGETTTWSCGATNDMTGTVYLQKQGEDTVYLVHTNKVTIFEKGRMELGDTSDATGDIASSEEVTSEVTSSETAASEAVSSEADSAE